MTHLRLSYVNTEHGGRTDAGYSAYSGDGGPYDYDRVTGMLHDGDARHEVLRDRAEVKDHRHRPVAAGAVGAEGRQPSSGNAEESESSPDNAGNTTLKQRVRLLTSDNRTLDERLQAVRSNMRFRDRWIADLEAQLLEPQAGE